MVKKISLLLLIILLFLYPGKIFANGFEVFVGISFNNFFLSKTLDGTEIPFYEKEEYENQYREQAERAIGFYFGGSYWINDDLGIEVGFDRVKSKYEGDPLGVDKKLNLTADKKISTEDLSGPYLGINYAIDGNNRLKARVVNYQMIEEVILKNNGEEVFNQISARAKGVGMILGGEFITDNNETMNFKGNLDYRLAKMIPYQIYNPATDDFIDIDMDLIVDMSGFRLGAALPYKIENE